METNNGIIEISAKADLAPATPSEINGAFWAGLAGLDSIAKTSSEVVDNFARAGCMLQLKRKDFKSRNAWLDWLAINCPDISLRTSDKLVSIADSIQRFGAAQIAIPQRLSYIQAVHESLVFSAITSSEQYGSASQEDKDRERDISAIRKVKTAISAFWKALSKRPPEIWQQEEREDFLIDLAQRDKIRQENGWELPPIDIEIDFVEAK